MTWMALLPGKPPLAGHTPSPGVRYACHTPCVVGSIASVGSPPLDGSTPLTLEAVKVGVAAVALFDTAKSPTLATTYAMSGLVGSIATCGSDGPPLVIAATLVPKSVLLAAGAVPLQIAPAAVRAPSVPRFSRNCASEQTWRVGSQ